MKLKGVISYKKSVPIFEPPCIIITGIHNKQSYFCVLRGSAATLFTRSKWVTIFWSQISSGFCVPKLIKIGSLFAELFKM